MSYIEVSGNVDEKLKVLANDVAKVGKINKAEYKTLLTLLNPFAPHITEEIWSAQNFEPSIKDAVWPVWDEAKLVKDEIEIAVQICEALEILHKIGAVHRDVKPENIIIRGEFLNIKIILQQ